ncbi:MAG: GMC oxidoreductase [Planctomycetota bacterium]
MIHDLNVISGATIAHADVCIVGAGTAGLFLASRLRRHGRSVVVLEAGELTSSRSSSLPMTVEQQGIHYRGAELGRSFGLGGTSVLWGGQMIPVTPSDIAARPWSGMDAWPVDYEELEPYFGEVAEVLGFAAAIPTGGVSDQDIVKKRFSGLAVMGEEFAVRVSTWLPFKTRNFSQEFAKPLREDGHLAVWLNAMITSFDTAPGPGKSSIKAVTAKSKAGHNLTVHATHYVLCAGALETTRLLLEHDDRTNGSITSSGAPLGRNFSDHLSATCGRFHRQLFSRFNGAVAPVFDGGLMRTPRLELSAAAQRAEGLPSAFAHVTFRTNGDTGFDVVRNFLRRRQGEQHELGLTPKRLGRVVHDVTAIAYWRYARTRLWIPREAEVLLQVDVEQVPNPDSRIRLSSERDSIGRKRLIVDWRITADDVAAINKVTRLTANGWKNSGLCRFADLEVVADRSFNAFDSLYDVYHPTGTLRMGSAERNSVVDRNLRIWALDNCYVSTTAVFPSAGSANPGFTHLALTARLAEHIAGQSPRAGIC